MLSTYINFDVENNDKDPKLKVSDHVRIWKHKNTFTNGYTPNWSKEVFMIKKVENAVPWANVIEDHNCQEMLERCME